MSADHRANEQEADENSERNLGFVGTFSRDLFPLKRIRIDVFFSLEILILRCTVLKVADKPLVCDSILLSFPAFMEQGDPDQDDHPIDETVWSIKYLLILDVVANASLKRDNGENEGKSAQGQEPARVVHEP